MTTTDPSKTQLQAFLQHISTIQQKEHDQQAEITALEGKLSTIKEEIETAKSDLLAATHEQRILVRDIAKAECGTAYYATENELLRREISALERVRADKARLVEHYLHAVVRPAFQRHAEYTELAECMQSAGCEVLADGESTGHLMTEPVELSHMKHHLAPYVRPKTQQEMFDALCELRRRCLQSTAHNTPAGEIFAPRTDEWFHPVCPRLTWNHMLAESHKKFKSKSENTK
ncbi:purine catabolism regulator-like protein [Perkinsela sp. CCAP 1560/4]|nr:purine catabolism regulator-like protein [Perkinsela sp. CCAP 1560/4]|eukprot:KNH07267.1 purine catabolism regulator-like protein [Perkinsela sp. CCAP 1560/4]